MITTRACRIGVPFALIVAVATSLPAQNLGHRLGGDVFEPENTLHCYRRALRELQDDPKFHYAELDVQETRDGGLVVFHDTGSIKRLVPKSSRNRSVLRSLLKDTKFESIRIADLTVKQVQRLVLAKGARIPTLEEVLDASVRWKLEKPILIEIKSLRTDACRDRLLATVAPYRAKLAVDFLAFVDAFRASFPDPVRCKAALKKHGFKVYTAYKPKTDAHDLAKGVLPEHLELEFRTVLPETAFQIVDERARSRHYAISVPRMPGAEFRLRIGIEHGYDDSGDRGVR